jgi:carboxylate-amine ligase
LQEEWLNARGAIARFDRNTIEIRVLDIQECPAADLAICGLAVGALRGLVDGAFETFAEQKSWPAERLAEILLAAIRDGEQAVVRDTEYLKLFGMQSVSATIGDVWRHIDKCVADRMGRTPETDQALEVILREGPLARRILRSLGNRTGDRHAQSRIYCRLCDCLERGEMFQ